jgi:CHAD domain-containing protein
LFGMPTAPTLPAPLAATPSDPPEEHVRALLDLRLRSLIEHEPGTRSGVDIEDLHQMRVAVRRMRAALKAAGPLLDPAWANGLRAELGWLGGALGPVRDLDVMLERLREEVAGLPRGDEPGGAVLVAVLDGDRVQARGEMLLALDDPRYAALLARLAGAVANPLPLGPPKRRPSLVELARAQARALRKAVARAGEDPPDEVLHALRIYGKRVRYTGELVAPGLRGTPAGDVIRRLLGATAQLQEVLGDHQDACVAEQRLRALVTELGDDPDPLAVFVAGRLVEREVLKAQRMRSGWLAAWRRVATQIEQLDQTDG